MITHYLAGKGIKHLVLPLQRALLARPDLFGKYVERASGYLSPHTEMTDIWVRYNDRKNLKNGDLKSFNEEHESVWYEAYKEIPEFAPVIFWIMNHVKGTRLGGVLVTKIPPGGGIEPHIDNGWHAEYYEKYYVPILNEEGSVFGFENGTIHGKPGEFYWFDNSVPHWVKNNSDTDRIAMIVCIRRT